MGNEKAKHKIEIKYRGLLGVLELHMLDEFLSKNAALIKEGYEKALYFESTPFPSIGDFAWGTARISLKCKDGGAYLRLKEGNPAAVKRSVYKIHVRKSEVSNLIYVLYRIGLREGFYRPAYQRKYSYENLLVTIKSKCVMGDHFEIELRHDSEQAKKELGDFLAKFKLRCWTETQYKNRITRLMKSNPAVDVRSVDMHI